MSQAYKSTDLILLDNLSESPQAREISVLFREILRTFTCQFQAPC